MIRLMFFGKNHAPSWWSCAMKLREVGTEIYLKNKYNRLFSKLFANFNIKPKKSVHEIRANVNKHFASLLYDWKRVCDEGLFFSTDWLMRKYVKKFCPELIVFLKPKSTSNRDLKYIKMYQTISENG